MAIKRSVRPRKFQRKTKAKGFSSKQVSQIRKIAQTTQETKSAVQTSSGLQVYHNGGILHVGSPGKWIDNLMATGIGPTDDKSTFKNRIGDAVAPVGVKLLMQFRQPVDRPNTNFKVWIVKHMADVPPTSLGMNPITGNLMLDSVDTEKCNVVMTKVFKASGTNFWTGDPGNSKEMTFHRKLWMKLPNSQYTYNGDGSTLGKRYNLACYVGAYDTSTSLPTDVIGYCHLSSVFYFKDA